LVASEPADWHVFFQPLKMMHALTETSGPGQRRKLE
jgi:hypothetical protein